MSLGTEILVAVVVVAALVMGGVAQLLAMYHLFRYLAVERPGQGFAALGSLSILWARGLSEAASNHRKRFIRWEATFLVCAAVLLAWDAFLRQPNSAPQSDASSPALNAPAHGAPGRGR